MMKRGLYRTQALVLNSFDFGESDRVIAMFTSGYGKLKAVAKGARRSKKRFVGKLDVLTEVDLVFFHSEKSELARMEEVALVDAFGRAKSDLARFSAGCYMAELVSELTREGQSLPQVYALLADFLRLLDAQAGDGAPPLPRFFEIKLLSLLGYMPHLTDCVACRRSIAGQPAEGADVFFVSEKGGVVCRECYRASGSCGGVGLSPGAAMFLASAARFDTDKLGRLRPACSILDESERVLDEFIRHQTGKELKTKRFLSKLDAASGAKNSLKTSSFQV